MTYFGRPLVVLLTLSTLIFSNCMVLGTTLWVSRWVDATAHDDNGSNTAFYLGLCVVLNFATAISEGCVYLAFQRGCWVAAKRLHTDLVSAVMKVPLSWFMNNPVGRVINRLSADMNSLDQSIAEPLTEFLDQSIRSVLMMGAVTSIIPIFVIPATLLSALGALLGEIYSRTTVLVKRVVSSSQSPVISHVSESLDGLAVIRARSDMPEVFGAKLNRLVYASARASAAQIECDQWLKFRTNALAALINFSAGLLAISRQRSMSAGLVGFSLSRASEMSSSILQHVFRMNELNIEMQAVSRMLLGLGNQVLSLFQGQCS